MHCLLCAQPIPDERWLTKQVTCSDACKEKLEFAKRRRRDKKKCRLCSRRIPLSKRIAADCEIALETIVSLGCGCKGLGNDDWHVKHCAVPIAQDALRELRGYRDRRAKARANRERSGAVYAVHTAAEETQ